MAALTTAALFSGDLAQAARSGPQVRIKLDVKTPADRAGNPPTSLSVSAAINSVSRQYCHGRFLVINIVNNDDIYRRN
jgi:hypothetical protein